jgi:hypothetical protein
MQVIADRVSAALACTSEEFCTNSQKITSLTEAEDPEVQKAIHNIKGSNFSTEKPTGQTYNLETY